MFICGKLECFAVAKILFGPNHWESAWAGCQTYLQAIKKHENIFSIKTL
jgi:hypothetical protein